MSWLHFVLHAGPSRMQGKNPARITCAATVFHLLTSGAMRSRWSMAFFLCHPEFVWRRWEPTSQPPASCSNVLYGRDVYWWGVSLSWQGHRRPLGSQLPGSSFEQTLPGEHALYRWFDLHQQVHVITWVHFVGKIHDTLTHFHALHYLAFPHCGIRVCFVVCRSCSLHIQGDADSEVSEGLLLLNRTT